jgi:acetolactate synthase-1/2/3 large subunit
MKLSDYVVDFVARLGVKHIFMLPGGGCMHLVDSVGRNSHLEYVCCLHEQACSFAAESYAEYGGGLSAILVTSGPGGTNAITGMAAAWVDSVSCLVISGQAKRSDLIGSRGVRSMGPQELDLPSIVRPITKYAVTIMDPQAVRYELEKAAYLATHGRPGPVWIEIPLDVQASQIDEHSLAGFDVPATDGTAGSLSKQVSTAIELLNQAQRPVLLLGNGARAAYRRGLIAELLRALPMPTLTTWRSLDMLPESHELYVGRPGAVGQRGANFTQQTADCLLILGSRLDLLQTAFNHANFAPAAKKIMVDIDPSEIAKMQMDITLPICGDAADFVAEFLRQADKLRPKDRSWWINRTKEWHYKYPVVLPEYWADSEGPVNIYVLVDVLSDEALEIDVIAPGSSGPSSEIFMQSFRVKPGQRVLNAPGLGAMGTGLPGAIGACLASGRRRTICVNGDGGFQLNIQDLETVHRLALPIKFFVLCNGAYASIMTTQRNYFQGRYVGCEPSSHLTLPDITKVAEAYGIATAHVENQQGIREQVRAVLEQPGPVVCAVRVSPDQPTQPRSTSEVRPDGSIVTRPMEDLYPLLSREEFQENMSVRSPEMAKG